MAQPSAPGFIYATADNGMPVGIAVDEKTGKVMASTYDKGVVKNFNTRRVFPAANGVRYSTDEIDNILDYLNTSDGFTGALRNSFLDGDFAYNANMPYSRTVPRLRDLTVNRPGHIGYLVNEERNRKGDYRYTGGSVYSDIYYGVPFSKGNYGTAVAGSGWNPMNWFRESSFPKEGTRVRPIPYNGRWDPQERSWPTDHEDH